MSETIKRSVPIAASLILLLVSCGPGRVVQKAGAAVASSAAAIWLYHNGKDTAVWLYDTGKEIVESFETVDPEPKRYLFSEPR